MKKLFFYLPILILTLFITIDVNAACTNLFNVETFYSNNDTTAILTSDSISSSGGTNQFLPRFNITGLSPSTTYKLSFEVEYSEEDPRYSLINTSTKTTIGYEFKNVGTKLSSYSNLISTSSTVHETYFETEFTTLETLTETSTFQFTIYSQTTYPIVFKNFKLYDASETCDETPPVDPPNDDIPDDSTGDSTGESVPLNNIYLILISSILMLIFMANFIKSCFKRRY